MKTSLAELREENRSTVEGLMNEMENIRKENRDIIQSIQFSSDRMDTIEGNMATTSADTASALKSAESAKNSVNALEKKILLLEAQQNKAAQEKLRNNLTITGISKSLDPVDAFWALTKAMDLTIEKTKVEAIELLNARPNTTKQGKQKYRTSTILVKFKQNATKVAMSKRKREMGAVFAEQVANLLPPQPKDASRNIGIFFRDHLTSYGMDLFAKAKEFQIQSGFKFLWTRDGDILMAQAEKSKVYPIRSPLDIDTLKAKFNEPQKTSA